MVAILFCALIVMLSPLQNVTSEIAARTQPNLFDLMIALFSALAGAYAMIRGREGTIVGVAIATALMPPLAVVGFGLGDAELDGVFRRAAAVLHQPDDDRAGRRGDGAALRLRAQPVAAIRRLLQSVAIGVRVLRARHPARPHAAQDRLAEPTASRDARDVVASQFGDNARVSQIDVDYKAARSRCRRRC